MEERLINCIRNGRTPHAIFICGPEGTGKASLARRAASLYCLGAETPERLTSCPNYAELSGRRVGVEQVRELMAAAGMQGFNGGKRAFVITDAHSMSLQSQNALLKTLEEPPADMLLILTGNEAGMLPTVRSRCMMLRLNARRVSEVRELLEAEGVGAAEAARWAQVSDGVPGRARTLCTPEGEAFYTDAVDLFWEAVSGRAPFAETAKRITRAPSDEDADGKRARPDPEFAAQLLQIWESLMRDVLVQRENGGSLLNVGEEKRICALASRFTSGRIQGIIEMLALSQKRLMLRANPQMTLDTVLSKLGIEEKI